MICTINDMLVHKLFPFPNLFSVYGNVAAKINYDLLAAFIKNENTIHLGQSSLMPLSTLFQLYRGGQL
jgi:hypothetical protein